MTKEQFIVKYSQGWLGDQSALKTLLALIVGFIFDALTPKVVTLDDNYQLTEDDSGGVFLIGTDAKVISLPATKAGLRYKIVNIGAAGNNIVTISPKAEDGISGTFTLAASVVVDAGVVNKDIINTKATSQAGDFVELIGTGVAGTTAWIVTGSAGIWAAQG